MVLTARNAAQAEQLAAQLRQDNLDAVRAALAVDVIGPWATDTS